ncbi:hypothetical protein KAR91_32705 [Candidatus Pacearchaeota archaeon]|nr:hypothetical protein [Candidatus Pacearchaeota archaeon]
MKLSEEEKKILTRALKETNNLPPAQGKVILNVSPEGKVSTAEIRILRK